MIQIRPLTPEQLAYVRRCYIAGWGLEPIAARLPGIGVASLKHHLWRTGINIRKLGGHRKMATVLPPEFNPDEFRPKPKPKKKSAPPPRLPPDPRVVAWHRPIDPGWRVHGEVRFEPRY